MEAERRKEETERLKGTEAKATRDLEKTLKTEMQKSQDALNVLILVLNFKHAESSRSAEEKKKELGDFPHKRKQKKAENDMAAQHEASTEESLREKVAVLTEVGEVHLSQEEECQQAEISFNCVINKNVALMSELNK